VCGGVKLCDESRYENLVGSHMPFVVLQSMFDSDTMLCIRVIARNSCCAYL
jgi:hypothetical protein